jgi:mRNA interferase RelE/StbE
MAYSVTLKRSAEKELDRLPLKIHDKIIKALFDLKNNSFPHNAKKLQARDGYRLKIGEYRVLYILLKKEKKIEIVSVGHRKEVYR